MSIQIKAEQADALYAENERLSGRVAELEAHVAVLREALVRIGQWDQLNPVQTGSDLPWLRGLVDQALSLTATGRAEGE